MSQQDTPATDHGYPLTHRREAFAGPIFTVYVDDVVMPGGRTARRDVTHHDGAVGVVALDDAGAVTLIRQYRHAVGTRLWELPAGLLDVAGEPALDAARRELAEEVDLVAAQWHRLVELHTSPGFSDERIEIFLARGLTSVAAADRYIRTEEEADMLRGVFDLDEAVAMALRGEITNAAAVAGLLATAWARDQAWATLRPA